MKLQPSPFDQIKTGTKILELRLFDEKRQSIDIGDQITFRCKNESVKTIVVGLSRFSSFINLLKTLDGTTAGWKSSDSPVSMAANMRKYYSEEDEKKYGVLGIHIQVAK